MKQKFRKYTNMNKGRKHAAKLNWKHPSSEIGSEICRYFANYVTTHATQVYIFVLTHQGLTKCYKG